MAAQYNVIGIDPQLIDPENGDYRVTPGSGAEGYGCQTFLPVQNFCISSKNIWDRVDLPTEKEERNSIEVSGIIDIDTFWDVDTVKVVGNLEIADGVTLCVFPGVKVEFQDFYFIDVKGCLKALGEPDENIFFTSFNPTLFSPDSTTLGAWNGIKFRNIISTNPSSILEYCTFEYSKSFTDSMKGGAISIYNCSKLKISNCRFIKNVADYGGALSFEYHSNPQIVGNIFADNSAFIGGSPIYCSYSFPCITNNTMFRNYVFNEDNYYKTGAIQTFISKPKTINNIIFSNETNFHEPIQLAECKAFYTTFNDIEFGHAGEGNIDLDPLFVNFGEHPFSLQENSPCIDSGITDTTGINLPTLDIMGNQRIWDGDGNGISVVDIGAYEFGSQQLGIQEDTVFETSGIYLLQNFPNPFNPETTISYQLSENSEVDLKVYNVKGQLVVTLTNEIKPAGKHSVIWHAKNCSSGIYFSKLKVNNYSSTCKMLLLK